ncbi:ion transporter [Larkinella terrae]|uniref:Ion transporter n=1 Tax=Larkinella terrae TaxID=2025311 RepID=A0A7K0EE52_9BACT|nr:ion transporter [Larkinella terrae]MRS59861.1 ion transporter [Larkinella terrae]
MSLAQSQNKRPTSHWRSRLHEVIFESDTPAGKTFDILLIGSILLSVTVVMLESIKSVRAAYGPVLNGIEWFFTGLFTIEYILRLISVRQPWRYALSFFGLVDILALLPTYLSWLVPGGHYLFTIRILRLLRVFRILKLSEYLSEATTLTTALRASRRKISVFILTVILLVVIIGSLMYLIEGEEHGFVSIPTGIYWAIVTLTTVGYGDLSPQTPAGKVLASLVMVMGYGIIAVPTGIVTVELSQAAQKSRVSAQACPSCGLEGHDADAVFCKYCGSQL